MAKINVRSPYYVYFAANKLDSAEISIWIYTGTQTASRPVTPTYALNSFAIQNAVNFEIAELVKDYMFYNAADYETEIVWVDYQIRKVVGNVSGLEPLSQNKGFYGFGYFEDGVNPQNDLGLLQSNNTIVKLDDAPVYLPVDTSKVREVSFYFEGEKVYEKNFLSGDFNSENQIQYVTNTVTPADEFEDRVVDDGGIFEGSLCLNEFLDDVTLFPVDTIYIYDIFNNDNGQIVKVKSIEECKYEPLKVSFINKFGALQDVWFFKRSNKDLSTTKESFKRNTLVTNNYQLDKHQQKNLFKKGNEKMTLNTGYYPEEYNEVFRQMQLSEDAWIEINNEVLPINISDSSFSFKTSLNDKLINYTIKIDFAFDTINNIR
tara:strand:- start:4629 stop:5753 length:1125 start_codon:yes stop_codon:yes gene_type:complete